MSEDTYPPCLPKVSVIMPVRNGINYIHEAIDSVLTQNYGNLELIIIDDGSDDYNYQLLGAYDRRITVIRLEGKGVSHARNVGMSIASGDYIAFLDSDDLWFPGKLYAQIRHLGLHPEVGVVFAGFIKWKSDVNCNFPHASGLIRDCSGLEEIDKERSGWLYTKLLMGLLVGMNTAVIRMQLYLQLGGFNETMRIGEDYDYWIRASRITQMHALTGPVALYRSHAASAMHRLDRKNHLAILLKAARKRWGLENPDGTSLHSEVFEKRIAAVEFAHAYNHYWNGDVSEAQSAFMRSFCGGHRRIRSLMYILFSWLRSATNLSK